ncbi:MAG: hypothetical protein A2Y17_09705 [Clostridiales bacterium GWF2_38_85]|nr:MAG: hypothetical protein A2Y17_09705 [Clostridiales bacterium GWF2_38_85]
MHFSEVAHYFDLIERESSRVKMTQLLAELFKKASPHEARIIAYLSLGTLRATYEGTQFNFASKGMVVAVARVLDISEAAVSTSATQTGDLGAVITLHPWTHTDSQATLIEIHRALVEFEQLSGSGSVEDKVRYFTTLLQSVDALSARYLVRIVLQKLRLGFSEMTLIDALSWALVGNKSLHDRIEYAFNVSADIGFIAELSCAGGIAAVDSIGITVGIPIRPAAAERLPSAAAIIEKIGSAIAEPKFDGFRLQVHVKKHDEKTELRFFSRNLLDMSAMFPDLKAALLDLPVQSAVVEGEALAFDEQTGSFLPFQETVKRRRKYDIQSTMEELPLKLVLFDILYLNGESFLEKSQSERHNALATIVNTTNNALLSVAEEIRVETADALQHYFLQNITAGLEGVVVKRPDSSYQPGKRNFNWIKLKRSERGKLDDTIDAVVLGYYYGKGKRASFGIGACLIGVYNKEEDRFETIAKIGTGFSDDEWKELRVKCDTQKVNDCPHNVMVTRGLEPDIWVAPEIMVVVRADEITRSPAHTAGKTADRLGFALRFPRFLEYRFDKSPTEATSVDEVVSLFDQQKVVGEE